MSYIQLTTGATGESLYAVFYSHDNGWIWDNVNSRWCSTSVASGGAASALDYGTQWSSVAVAMTEDAGSASDPTGHYQLLVPSGVESGVDYVDVVIRKSDTSAPAISDAVVAAGTHRKGGSSIEISVA